MRELDKVLNTDEKVFWEGGPSFWPFFIGRSVAVVLFGLVWMSFMMVFIVAAFNSPGPFKYFVFAMPHFWIGLLLVFGIPIYNALVFKRTYYAITNKRVLLQTGIIGRDFTMVDFDQVTNSGVDVGLFDKLFGGNTGSISISTAGTFTTTKQGVVPEPYVLGNVANPYEVFKFLKQVSHDVKTDIQYPNDLRPTENPGYKTNYDPNVPTP